MYMYTAQGQFVEHFQQRCTDVSNRQQCSETSGCKWENDECVPKCTAFGKALCTSYDTCRWNERDGSCVFAQRGCSLFDKKECNDEYDCKWLHDECVQNCNSYDKERCLADSSCEWDNKKDCFFKHKRCYQETKENCNKNEECTWNDNECAPRCEVFNKDRCESYRACAWDQNNECYNVNRSCSKIDTAKDCKRQSECSWKNEECIPRCNMFDKTRCDSYKDCIWNTERNTCGFKRA